MADETKKEVITDDMYIAKWRGMLKIFHDLIEDTPPVSKIKDELLELSEEAKNTFHLTPNQKRGIMERCSNYIDGTYGKHLSTLAH